MVSTTRRMSCASPGSSKPCDKDARGGSLQVVAVGHLAPSRGARWFPNCRQSGSNPCDLMTAYPCRDNYQAGGELLLILCGLGTGTPSSMVATIRELSDVYEWNVRVPRISAARLEPISEFQI